MDVTTTGSSFAASSQAPSIDLRALALLAQRLRNELAGGDQDRNSLDRRFRQELAIWTRGLSAETLLSMSLDPADTISQVLACCIMAAEYGQLSAHDPRARAFGPPISPLVMIAARLSEPRSVLRYCPAFREMSGLLQAVREQGNSNEATDWLLYGYETFLRYYDLGRRQSRGVYFTPRPIAGYLVRSVNHLLERDFGIAGGLCAVASDAGTRRVQTVDPACGSGVFLLEVLNQIAAGSSSAEERPLSGLPLAATSRALLTASDLEPVCCLVAQHVVAQALRQLHEPLAATVLAANALDESSSVNANLRQSVDRGDLLVLLGNPPYSNFGRRGGNRWMDGLLMSYKRGVRERKLNLQDDFIRFIRWGQYWIEQAGDGILAVITNSTYLDGLTHRGMRHSLRSAFDEVYILDLHGHRLRSSDAKGSDENVFGIQQGVALSICVRRAARGVSRTSYSSLHGTRAEKLAYLEHHHVGSTVWQKVDAVCGQPFLPSQAAPNNAYARAPGLTDIFEHHISGIQTKNDGLWTALSRDILAERMRAHLEERRDKSARYSSHFLQPLMVAPFDRRWVYYDGSLIGRARSSVMRHMTQKNLGLVFMRQSTNAGVYDHFLVVDALVTDRVFFSAHGAPFLAPLYRYVDGKQVANIRSGALADFAQHIGRKRLSPRTLLAYIYAITHSTRYRQHNRGALRTDFPRIPYPKDRRQFLQLAHYGRRLIGLHLLRCITEEASPVGEGEPCIIKRPYPRFVCGDGQAGQLCLSDDHIIERVPVGVWNFSCGGYRVIERWLKQRRGVTLGTEELRYVRRLIAALSATGETIEHIDATLEA